MASSPECDEHASAISASFNPSRAAAPVSTIGSASSAFTAERG